jgi:hypothetical protein
MIERRRLCALLLTTAAALLPTAWPRAAFAVDPPSDTRASELLREGIALARDHHLEQARAKMREAYELWPTYDVAANLGYVECDLGEWRDAATHLQWARKHLPLNVPQQAADEVDKALAQAKSHVGGVMLDAEPGTGIFADGEKVGVTPLEGPFYLTPGRHQLRSERAGFQTSTEAIDLRAGEVSVRRIELKPETTASVPPAEPRPAWPGWLMGGTGLASAALGGVLIGLGESKLGDADEIGAQIASAGGRCEPASGPGSDACANGADTVGTANGLVGGGGVALGVGIALLGAGIAYLAWPEAAPDSARITPWIGPGVAGIGVSGGF